MKHFSIETAGLALPSNAKPELTHALNVSWKGRAVAGLRQAVYRSYVYPVLTPSGMAVSTDVPTDHPW